MSAEVRAEYLAVTWPELTVRLIAKAAVAATATPPVANLTKTLVRPGLVLCLSLRTPDIAIRLRGVTGFWAGISFVPWVSLRTLAALF